jgi:hypothetical protein
MLQQRAVPFTIFTSRKVNAERRAAIWHAEMESRSRATQLNACASRQTILIHMELRNGIMGSLQHPLRQLLM